MRFRHFYIFLLCTLLLPMVISAQINLFNTGAGNAAPPDTTKGGAGGNAALQKRIDELRKQGVPEDVIQGYIQQQGGQKPPNQQGNTQGQTAGQLPGQTPPDLSPTALAEKAAEEEKKRIQTVRDSVDAFKQEIIDEYNNKEKFKKQRQYQAALKDPNTLFGQHIFIIEDPTRNDTATYLPPDEYIVQKGDKFNIEIVGEGELFEPLEVGRDGSVYRQFMGKKYIGGMTYKEAQKVLVAAYKKIVPDKSIVQITLFKNQSNISVNVVGEVKNPGTYTLPAVTNAISALFAAQGINEMGSVRHILVKRADKVIKEIDLYALLVEGKTDLVFLKNDDYIFVPAQGAVIQLQGSVRRPMRYELKEGENVNQAIRFAGGLLYDASAANGQIGRLENGKDVLLDFNVKNEGSKVLKDGDILRIRSEYRRLDKMAQVEGEVRLPGTYHWRSGRVKDLIDAAGGLTPDAFKSRAFVVRVTKPGVLSNIPINLEQLNDTNQNIRIQYLDKLIIFNQKTFGNKKQITVFGAVKNPNKFDIAPNANLRDVLLLAGGLTEDADPNSVSMFRFNFLRSTLIDTAMFNDNLVIFRREEKFAVLDKGELASAIFKREVAKAKIGYIIDSVYLAIAEKEMRITRSVDLGKDWISNANLDTTHIGLFQFIYIPSSYQYRQLELLSVEGGVNKPTRFEPNADMTLKDVIYACGGIKEGIDIDYIDMYVRMDIKETGNFGLSTRRKEIVRLRFTKEWQSDAHFDSVRVQDYYKIVIHNQGEFIQKGEIDIKGLVNNPGRFDYSPRMTLKDAIYMAKGIKIDADIARIEVSSILDVENTNGEILPLKVKVKSYQISQDWQKDPLLETILLYPYDQVFIRPNPDFKLQQSVRIDGEVLVPGEYTILQANEKLSTFIARSGGFTKLAFPEGAYLERVEYGKIAIRLDKAIANPGSRYDIVMREKDRLVIPVLPEVVTINGNVEKSGTSIMFDPSQTRFKYYVDLAGGFKRKTRVGQCTVEYPNGTVKKVKTYLFLRKYPKISQGAIVNVPNRDDGKKPEETVDSKAKLNTLLANIIGTTTSVMTLLVLIKAATSK